jgi:hypothetical protein
MSGEYERLEDAERRAALEDRSRRANGHAADTGSPRFKLVPFADIKLATSSPWLVKGLIPREGLVVVWGPPKCGKSFFVFDLLMHVALGWDYRGRKVTQAPVVYVACEGERGLGARVAAFKQKHGVADAPFYLITTRLDLVAERDKLIGAIRAQIGDIEPGAIAIDTLNRSIAGSESSDEDMGNYVKAADAVREAFRCVVIVVHHCGHDDKRPRGHTSLTGAADAQLATKSDGDGLVTTAVEYLKDGAAGDVISSRLEQLTVGTDEDGAPITSCVVVPAEDVTLNAEPKPVPPAAKLALELLNACIVDHGVPAPASEHIPAWVKGVTKAEWRRHLERGGVVNAEGNPREQQRRLIVTLKNAGLIGAWDDFIWPVTKRHNPVT